MDIKKQIEALAKDAGIAAKGQVPICSCATCEEALTEAESIIEDLCKNFCGQFAHAVLAIGLYRIRSVVQGAYGGPMAAVMQEIDWLGQTESMGLEPEKLCEAINKWQNEVNPAKGPI